MFFGPIGADLSATGHLAVAISVMSCSRPIGLAMGRNVAPGRRLDQRFRGSQNALNAQLVAGRTRYLAMSWN
jgi:hypothetical protein